MKNLLLGVQSKGARRLTWALGAGALAATLGACGPGHGTDCLKSNGAVTTERREVAHTVNTVAVYDNVDVVLVQDSGYYAEVRAGENVIGDIELTQVGPDRLEISNSSRCNWVRSYDTPREVTVHLPNLLSVEQRGSALVSTAPGHPWRGREVFAHLIGYGDMNLEVDVSGQLLLDMYEFGDFTLRGQAHTLNWTLGGNGRLFADELRAYDSFFITDRDSNGNAYVRASNLVGGTVGGRGTVYYAGPPAHTDLKVTGRGQAVAR